MTRLATKRPVSDARYELMQHNLEMMRSMYDALLEKYHALASGQTIVTVPATVEEPDTPPPAVLAAIQTISPVRDKTYDANWAYWGRNKARAAAHPDAFAEEIIAGVVFEPLSAS